MHSTPLSLWLLLGIGCQRTHIDEFEVVPASPVGFEVEILDAEAVAPGTTLVTDGSFFGAPRIVEVDIDGNVVWQHRVPEERHTGTAVMDAAPLGGGHVLYSVDGLGVFEIDADGELVWSYLDSTPSHDVDRLASGNTLITNGWAAKGEAHFFEIDPSGAVGWSWDGLEQYDHAPYSEVELEGWIHANAAQRQPDGTTLVSLRNFNRVALLDLDGSVIWDFAFYDLGEDASSGTVDVAPGRKPHEPELTPSGTVLVSTHDPSQVYEVDPADGSVVWTWDPIVADMGELRDANRLANGNTLVTGAWALVEIDPSGAVLWQLRANGERQEGSSHKPLFKAVRIAPDGTVYGD